MVGSKVLLCRHLESLVKMESDLIVKTNMFGDFYLGASFRSLLFFPGAISAGNLETQLKIQHTLGE